MEDTRKAVVSALAELARKLDARLKRLSRLFPYIVGFFFGDPFADRRPLPDNSRFSRHERDITFGVYREDKLERIELLEIQSFADMHMDERAPFYLTDPVHTTGARSRVRLGVLHLTEVRDRDAVPSAWPWRSDDVVYTWQNFFIVDCEAAAMLRADMPALAALSSAAKGGTEPQVISRALDLILTLNCSEPDLISAIALHRFLAELHSSPRDLWKRIMNEKNEHLAVEVENNPFFQAVLRMIDREKQPLVEQLEEERRQASEQLAKARRQASAMKERAHSAEERAESEARRAKVAERRYAEAEQQLEALRARNATHGSVEE